MIAMQVCMTYLAGVSADRRPLKSADDNAVPAPTMGWRYQKDAGHAPYPFADLRRRIPLYNTGFARRCGVARCKHGPDAGVVSEHRRGRTLHLLSRSWQSRCAHTVALARLSVLVPYVLSLILPPFMS